MVNEDTGRKQIATEPPYVRALSSSFLHATIALVGAVIGAELQMLPVIDYLCGYCLGTGSGNRPTKLVHAEPVCVHVRRDYLDEPASLNKWTQHFQEIFKA
jgi:hypothetical protein